MGEYPPNGKFRPYFGDNFVRNDQNNSKPRLKWPLVNLDIFKKNIRLKKSISDQNKAILLFFGIWASIG